MRYTHPIDRAAYALRGVILGATYLCAPIYMISYGWMLKKLLTTAPGWVSAVVILAHIIVWIGIASLFDRSQERRQTQELDQSARPPLN